MTSAPSSETPAHTENIPSSTEATATHETNPVVSFAPPMVPSEVFDRDKHLKMLNIPTAKVGSSLVELVPKTTDESDRRASVAAHVGRALIFNKDFRGHDDKYRPRGPRENIMAWRMRHKLGKLSLKNAAANTIARTFSYVLKEEALDSDSGKPNKVITINPDKYEELNFFEKGRARKNRRLYNRLQRSIRRLEYGRKLPFTNKRIMGFEQIVRGGLSEKEKRALDLRRAFELMGMDGTETNMQGIAETLQDVISSRGEIFVQEVVKEYSAHYLENVGMLNMDPLPLTEPSMLRYLATERFMVTNPKAAGQAYEGVNDTDPFVGTDTEEGQQKLVDITQRLIGMQFIDRAVQPDGDDFKVDYSFMGSLLLNMGNEKEVLDIALQFRRDVKAGRPASIRAAETIGHELLKAAAAQNS